MRKFQPALAGSRFNKARSRQGGLARFSCDHNSVYKWNHAINRDLAWSKPARLTRPTRLMWSVPKISSYSPQDKTFFIIIIAAFASWTFFKLLSKQERIIIYRHKNLPSLFFFGALLPEVELEEPASIMKKKFGSWIPIFEVMKIVFNRPSWSFHNPNKHDPFNLR